MNRLQCRTVNPCGGGSSPLVTAKRKNKFNYYKTYENTDGTIGVTASKPDGAIKNLGDSASWWWLRSAYLAISNQIFFYVRTAGGWRDASASNTGGVSPAFRIG